MNILLQILDDGRITDAQGRTVNFENTIIVMTTNAGSDDKAHRQRRLQYERRRAGQEKAVKALNEFLRPEFINRVDEIIYFHRLTEENIRAIASLMLEDLRTAMAERGTALTWDDSLVDYLVGKRPTCHLRRRAQPAPHHLRSMLSWRTSSPRASSTLRPPCHAAARRDEGRRIDLLSL